MHVKPPIKSDDIKFNMYQDDVWEPSADPVGSQQQQILPLVAMVVECNDTSQRGFFPLVKKCQYTCPSFCFCCRKERAPIIKGITAAKNTSYIKKTYLWSR